MMIFTTMIIIYFLQIQMMKLSKKNKMKKKIFVIIKFIKNNYNKIMMRTMMINFFKFKKNKICGIKKMIINKMSKVFIIIIVDKLISLRNIKVKKKLYFYNIKIYF